MDARSALFDVYGDHLRTWPELDRAAAPVAALVRLLAPLGIRPPAVRTAVSRMLHQGWLEAARTPSGPGYALTSKAVRRLDEAAKRIYRTTAGEWDGQWHLLVVTGPSRRSARERLHASLAFLGYGSLGGSTWVAPRPAPELAPVLEEARVRGQRFTARYDDDDTGALVSRAWDLPGLAREYSAFLADARTALAEAPTDTDEGAFAARLRLVHAWRRFLNVDPGLPPVLLPADWPGTTAAAWFDEESARLLPAARRFVRTCLSAGRPPSTADPAPAQEGPSTCPPPSAPAPSCSTSQTASPPSRSTARRA